MVKSMRTRGVFSPGGEGYTSATVDADFPPENTLVTTSISRFGNLGGVVKAGILNVRVRNAQGFDDTIPFANTSFDALPAAVARNQMTHVTMLVESYDGWTLGLLTVFHTDFKWS